MADNSKIEWCDASWNPIRARLKGSERWGYHCERISPGCQHCYACTMNGRMLPSWGTGLDYTVPNRQKVDIFLDEKELLKPLSWKKPKKIFPCSMTDWCADFVTDEMRDRMLAVAALCPQHEFLFLTKRADRCAEYLAKIDSGCYVGLSSAWCNHRPMPNQTLELPLTNVRIGFSAENQQCFDERWEDMRPLAAAGWKVWASLEPLLGPIAMEYIAGYLSWAVIGGESGHGARPMDIGWVRSLIAQCKASGTVVFCKQLGAKPEELVTVPRDGHQWMRRLVLKDRKGGEMAEWPEDLRVRQFPEAKS